MSFKHPSFIILISSFILIVIMSVALATLAHLSPLPPLPVGLIPQSRISIQPLTLPNVERLDGVDRSKMKLMLVDGQPRFSFTGVSYSDADDSDALLQGILQGTWRAYFVDVYAHDKARLMASYREYHLPRIAYV